MSVSTGDILTAEEVGELLQLRTSTVHEMARRGELVSFALGKHRRFHRDDITASIDAMRAESKAENVIALRSRKRMRQAQRRVR